MSPTVETAHDGRCAYEAVRRAANHTTSMSTRRLLDQTVIVGAFQRPTDVVDSGRERCLRPFVYPNVRSFDQFILTSQSRPWVEFKNGSSRLASAAANGARKCARRAPRRERVGEGNQGLAASTGGVVHEAVPPVAARVDCARGRAVAGMALGASAGPAGAAAGGAPPPPAPLAMSAPLVSPSAQAPGIRRYRRRGARPCARRYPRRRRWPSQRGARASSRAHIRAPSGRRSRDCAPGAAHAERPPRWR